MPKLRKLAFGSLYVIVRTTKVFYIIQENEASIIDRFILLLKRVFYKNNQ